MATTKLFAPTGYWCLTADGKRELCNGCGAAGKVDLVPDHLLGLDISECCNIHDYTYATAEASIAAKDSADRSFLNNMLRIVADAGGPLKRARMEEAWLYYEAVRRFGGVAFWSGKNLDEEEKAA